jgi:hypothetical protein
LDGKLPGRSLGEGGASHPKPGSATKTV